MTVQVGFDRTGGSSIIDMQACCGGGCSPTNFDQIRSQDDGGSNDCQTYMRPLPAAANDCSSLMLRFDYPNRTAEASLDDLTFTGDLIFAPITPAGGGPGCIQPRSPRVSPPRWMSPAPLTTA